MTDSRHCDSTLGAGCIRGSVSKEGERGSYWGGITGLFLTLLLAPKGGLQLPWSWSYR